MCTVFEQCPVIENKRFLLRLVTENDAKDLLMVYSDKNSLPFLIAIIVMAIFSIIKQKRR